MGTSNVFVLSKQFDVCIIDEAAQISIPAVLGPIMRCKQFVLVGDPHQLRPLVTSKQAQGEGMGETLLEKLSNKHFKVKVMLWHVFLLLPFIISKEILHLLNTFSYVFLIAPGYHIKKPLFCTEVWVPCTRTPPSVGSNEDSR